MELEPVTPPHSLVDLATERIREAIQSGVYNPSQRLVERRLAESMGVSTITIREALERLAGEGLIIRQPRRGAIVAPVSDTTIRDITRIRQSIEQLVTEEAAAHWTHGASEEARAIVRDLQVVLLERDYDRFSQLDRAFHELRWRLAGNERLSDIAKQLYGSLVRHQVETLKASSRVTEVRDPRAAIYSTWIDAVEARDVARAKEIVDWHVVVFGKMIVDQLQLARESST